MVEKRTQFCVTLNEKFLCWRNCRFRKRGKLFIPNPSPVGKFSPVTIPAFGCRYTTWIDIRTFELGESSTRRHAVTAVVDFFNVVRCASCC